MYRRILLLAVELASWLLIIALIFAGVYLYWVNPDVTDRRFFIEHWPFYLIGFGASLTAFWAHDANKNVPKGYVILRIDNPSIL
jgi:hypothetical protein